MHKNILWHICFALINITHTYTHAHQGNPKYPIKKSQISIAFFLYFQRQNTDGKKSTNCQIDWHMCWPVVFSPSIFICVCVCCYQNLKCDMSSLVWILENQIIEWERKEIKVYFFYVFVNNVETFCFKINEKKTTTINLTLFNSLWCLNKFKLKYTALFGLWK